ncbi:type I-E CRISPR-associated protein Cas5/CasD [Amycolatopsis sp. NPDC059021]|uniref:type I-E CRISPR-associated protein Cas5/CasD n=1 Tax=Amycolatopsis sp. NPDC059021 TaxID=3346704 RepID=UPI00366E8464
MTTLTLCFDAPMQSWGLRSRGVLRDTAMEPTKSGVVGLLAAAMGVERDDEAGIAELAALRLGIRVDREGLLERDYQTAQNVPTTLGTGHRTVVSERYYLADALFLVALEGPGALLGQLAGAVVAPRWPLCFGRRAFVPARPVLSGIHDGTLERTLREHPWLEHPGRAAPGNHQERLGLRTVIDCGVREAGAQPRHDVPLSFARTARRFATRAVRIGEVPLTEDMIITGEPSCS